MKAIFLDRDGTLNEEKHYLYKIEDFVFLPKVTDGLRLLQDAGFLLLIVTNQSGIARGYYTEEDFQKLNQWMLQRLKVEGIEIAKVYYCPHLPEAIKINYRRQCDCRKPALGMFAKAVREFNIDLCQSYAIGDKLRDCALCRTTTCQGYLIGNSEKEETIARVKQGKVKNVKYAENLYACAQMILS